MVLQREMVCCERCWCGMVKNDNVTWNVVWFGIMPDCLPLHLAPHHIITTTFYIASFHIKQSGITPNHITLCYTLHISPSQLNNISHHSFRHSTPYHITHFNTTRSHSVMWDNVVRNMARCGMFCNARCGMLRLIHPNVAVMWSKVRCRIYAI